jgi:hypothetical protein
MPVHIDEMTSEVGVLDGELPLTDAQIERLTQLILERLEVRQREREAIQEESVFRSSRVPSLRTVD